MDLGAFLQPVQNALRSLVSPFASAVRPIMGALAPAASGGLGKIGSAIGGSYGGPLGAVIGGGLGSLAGDVVGGKMRAHAASPSPFQAPHLAGMTAQSMPQQLAEHFSSYVPHGLKDYNVGELGHGLGEYVGNRYGSQMGPMGEHFNRAASYAGEQLNPYIQQFIPQSMQNVPMGDFAHHVARQMGYGIPMNQGQQQGPGPAPAVPPAGPPAWATSSRMREQQAPDNRFNVNDVMQRAGNLRPVGARAQAPAPSYAGPSNPMEEIRQRYANVSPVSTLRPVSARPAMAPRAQAPNIADQMWQQMQARRGAMGYQD